MSRFVRSSKYRHVFAPAPKRDEQYEGIHITKNAWDSNYVIANPKFIAVAWQVGGGGAVGVLNVGDFTRMDQRPLFTGHKASVLDLDFNPFNDNIFATASEDCFAKIWQIPEGGLKETTEESVQVLKGHRRKIGAIKFHPTAENVIATAAQDYDVKVWDISSGEEKHSIPGHAGIIQSIDWSYDGSRIYTYCKDKKLRILDPRGNSVVSEVDSHQGVKGARVVPMGKHDKIITVGFGKGAQREYAIWDPRNMEAPLLSPVGIDNSSGVLVPFYDEDSDILFIAGKGDGNIRYYEVLPEEEGKKMVAYLGQYSSSQAGAAYGAAPKRACDVNSNEIMRIYKVTGTSLQPLCFKVPRKSELFQEDIFPPCRSDEAALTAEQWFSGEDSTPKTKSLEGGFVAKEPKKTEFTKQEETEKKLSEDEVRKAYEEAQKRIAYLEAEMAKKDAQIKELSS